MSSPATSMKTTLRRISLIAHEKQFLGELKDIRKVADSFDVVMFPIDGRVGRSSSARLLPTGRKNGYTFGKMHFRLAKLALSPFGKELA